MPQDSRIRARAPRTSSATPLDADQVWRILCDGAPDAMVVFDGAGVVRGFNVAAARMFRRRPKEVLGAPLERFLPPDEGGLARLVSECLPGVEDPSTEPHEVRLLAPDGTATPAEGTLAVTETPEGELYILQLRDAASRKGLEFALLETEERLAGLTANLPGIVFQRVMRADGRLYYPFFTTGVRDVLGFEPEEMRVNSEGCLDTVHWADRGAHMAAIRHSAASMTPCVEEFRAITRTGEVRWLRGTSRPQRLAEGDILWDGVLLDVTDRKRAEIRLEMIMDHAADSIVTVDEGGRIESVNAAAVELFGYSGPELIGRNISVLMPEPYRSRHEASMMRYIATGEGDLIGQGPRELLGLRKDGGAFPLELSTSEVRMEGRRIFVGIGRDVTLRKQTEAALRETEQRLRGIAANLPGIVFQRVLKADGSLHYAYVSEGCLDVLGVDPADLMADASLFLAAMPPEDRRTFMEALHHSARSLDPFDEEVRIAVRDGGERWLRGQSRPRLLDNGDVAWDGVALDVTDRKEAEERLRFLAYHDPLTGVANRALFHERFNQARTAAQRTRSRIAVLSLGIDRFSIINTTLGHAIGDEVLRAAADRLRGCVKDDDLVARAGGDRFLVMLAGVHNDSAVNDVVDIIMASSAEPLVVRGEELDLTASIGIAVYPRDGEDAATLVKNADAALLLAKGQGAGSVQFFTQEMNARALKTLSLQNRLRRALENEEFVPYYQPQVDLASGRVVGAEALARWISPELGIVPPGEFIPVAEEYGLIDGICEQMLRATCHQNRAWQDAGLPAISIAVNLSGRQFQNPRRLVHALETVLAQSGLEAHYLELELTESSAMRDPDMAVSVMRMIKEEMGIGCSIDDFGTGYSSLSVLKRFPLQKLKIDRSFVADVTSDANDAAIVDAIIAMAHALRLKVVAEGVETVEHLEFLRDLGCDQIQGYLFSRPLPAAELEALLVEGRSLAPTPGAAPPARRHAR